LVFDYAKLDIPDGLYVYKKRDRSIGFVIVAKAPYPLWELKVLGPIGEKVKRYQYDVLTSKRVLAIAIDMPVSARSAELRINKSVRIIANLYYQYAHVVGFLRGLEGRSV
jgi:hypothetical protein